MSTYDETISEKKRQADTKWDKPKTSIEYTKDLNQNVTGIEHKHTNKQRHCLSIFYLFNLFFFSLIDLCSSLISRGVNWKTELT